MNPNGQAAVTQTRPKETGSMMNGMQVELVVMRTEEKKSRLWFDAESGVGADRDSDVVECQTCFGEG